MPFTLSHPIAALALKPTRLPMAATVAGTMAPDLPLFLRSNDGYDFTHSLLGIVTADLAIGLAGLAVWNWLLRDALVDGAPPFVRDRFTAHARYLRRDWLLAVPAVVAGALTHVGWDELTHKGRWGPDHIAWLREDHHGVAGYHWAQGASSVLGLAAVGVWALVHILRQPRRTRGARVPRFGVVAPAIIVAATAIATVVGAAPYLSDDLHEAAFAGAVRGVATLAVTLLTAAVAWQVAARRNQADVTSP